MTTKSSDSLSYGITILIFGILILLDKIGILPTIPYIGDLISVGFFFLIAGTVFLITQPKKVLGWVFFAIGVLLNSDLFFGWMDNYSKLIIPIGLVIVGAILIFNARKK